MKINLLVASLFWTVCSPAVADLDPETFRNPPDEARPMTWMHMMNGNASEAGLVKDLRALKEAGVGGALIFSIKKNIADGEVEFNSQEFRDIIVAGAAEAETLGLKIGVHNCDGWSSSGGPWVKTEDAMKRVAWSEVVVPGGAVQTQLPRPKTRHDFFRDIAVVAYKVPDSALDAFTNPPKLSASHGDCAVLEDGDLETSIVINTIGREKKHGWLRLDYQRPFTAQSIHFEHHSRHGRVWLSASQDGQNFVEVVELTPKFRPGKMIWAYEMTFPPVTARAFRVAFDTPTRVFDLELSDEPRLTWWLARSAVAREEANKIEDLPPESADAFVPMKDVRVLTRALGADGRLAATLPEGTWRIMRFGFTVTGAYNHPATDVGRGHECDKLDAAALDRHFAEYVGKLANECGELAGKSFMFSEIDSYEMGGQNWTWGLAETFKAEKGYDLVPFLPLVAGRMIGDAGTADAVLGDLRSLVAKLMTENYYKRFMELCHQHGMKSYVEPYGFGPLDDLSAGGQCDIPMGEFWMGKDSGTFRSAVSSAHSYGKNIISAEAFTSWKDLNWKIHPYLMKRSGDNAWAEGINEFMFHRFAHQANTHVVPGMTMDSIGSHIDRTQTWWFNGGKAWMKYLQRGCWMLRQGVPVSDVMVYVGEGSPHWVPSPSDIHLPAGYNMDHCDTEVLLNRLSVQDGMLVLPEGTAYPMLMLANGDRMSFRVLARIGELAEKGARVVGAKPTEPIGYVERVKRSGEFAELAERVWAKKNVREGATCEAALEHFPIEPDLLVELEQRPRFMHRRVGDADIYFLHNREELARTLKCSFRVGDRQPELWFADTGNRVRPARYSQKDGRTELAIEFDPLGSVFVVFRSPSEDLDPVVTVEPSSTVLFDAGGKPHLETGAEGGHRIEFASGHTAEVEVSVADPIPLDGAWDVMFDGTGLKDTGELKFDRLSDWKDHPREDIRHFSGTAAYRKTVELPAGWVAAGRRVSVELGQVAICAEVFVNGKPAGVLWKPPFAADITGLLQPGRNELEVRVTNQWTNRLIGDERFESHSGYRMKEKMPEWYVKNRPMPEGPRSTFCTYNFYDKDRTLLPSGLLGPVRLVQEAVVPIP